LYPGKFLKFNQSEWYVENPEQPIRIQKAGNFKFGALFYERVLIGQNPEGISKKREMERIKQKSKVSTVIK